MATFNFVRLSLSIPPLGALADDGARPEPALSRTEFLRYAFSKRVDFFHRGKLVTYVPADSDVQSETTLVGFFGRKFSKNANDGPDERFKPVAVEFFHAATVVIDTRSNKQVVAFEHRNDLGSALTLLESFFSEVRQKLSAVSWHVDAEYIAEERDFWSAVRQYRGHITEVAFEFFPPNGVDGFNDFKKFNRTILEASNGEGSKYSLHNAEGNLNPSGELVDEAVKYAHEGPGRVLLKNGRKVLYRSSSSRISVDVPEAEMPREMERLKLIGLADFLLATIRR